MTDDQPGPSNQAVANGDQQIVKSEGKQVANQAEHIKSMLQAMALQQQKQGVKENYEFWETQPVAQFNEDPSTLPVSMWTCTVATDSSQPTLFCHCVLRGFQKLFNQHRMNVLVICSKRMVL